MGWQTAWEWSDDHRAGVITAVQSNILKTYAVIVDALLGQGEALDCYNMRLQEEASRGAELRNNRCEQETAQEAAKISAALAAIAAIPDPVAQAEAYRNVFGECCDVDRLGLNLNGCGCTAATPVTPTGPAYGGN